MRITYFFSIIIISIFLLCACVNDLLIGSAWSGIFDFDNNNEVEVSAIFYNNNIMHLFIEMEQIGSEFGRDFSGITSMLTGEFTITNFNSFSAELSGSIDLDGDLNNDIITANLNGSLNNVTGQANGDYDLSIKLSGSTMIIERDSTWYLNKN